MSRLNIQGIIKNIRSKTNVYTPIIEAIVNSIDAITESGVENGRITISVKRENTLSLNDNSIPSIKSFEVSDNGIGFTPKNRDSFDTYLTENKIDAGGKGFGRFMFLKYFNDAKVESIYHENEKVFKRTFVFGKKYQIIEKETNDEIANQAESGTTLFLNTVLNENLLDKELDTIARKLVEKLLIFFINEKFNCPQIVLKEFDGSHTIVLNDFVSVTSDIRLVDSVNFSLANSYSEVKQEFVAKIFKVYFAGNLRSKISLTANNREVTDVSLHNYIPEFEDDFFEEEQNGESYTRKNYIIKTYVLGDYLNESVSHERETFNFDKERGDSIYPLSQADIEARAAEVTKEAFKKEVQVRSDKKRKKIVEYINDEAPWHKPYINDLDFASMPYSLSNEKIELTLQQVKFRKEQEAKAEISEILQAENNEFEEKLAGVISKITEAGKNDLAHYVSTRKTVLQIFEDLLRRNTDGKTNLEKEIHEIIFPMGKDSTNVSYEDHNLWLLDERLVFSEYVASDKKISKKKDALDEPDLLIFDKKKTFRNGDNEFSNPLTVFEFKRPKRETYKQEEDPVLQVGEYIEKIRAGKYELPDGLEKVKVNENTPVYCYVVADLTDKIKGFAKVHSLTQSPDGEGYFGFHSGYKMYVEIISFRKLLRDANLRNKIFFNKLNI
ncbi:ATP-binding protein [Chitinophagaceae bacterium IBVUCB1]|nr:ATP-binding protein [Chitinophagaceae bacterium IBVUCB1]